MNNCSEVHVCNCGTSKLKGTHAIGQDGCVRRMEEPPLAAGPSHWYVACSKITDFTLRQQRGYSQHKCGCWSSWRDSVNSVDA